MVCVHRRQGALVRGGEPMTRHQLRLRCDEFFVDMRLMEHESRWLAVADTPDGPSIGWGQLSVNAAVMALQPFDGRIEELLASVVHHGIGKSGS